VKWKLVYTKQAQKDAKKLGASGLKEKARALLEVLEASPYQNPPPYEKLVGDLKGAYSRRVNIQHRVVYRNPRKAPSFRAEMDSWGGETALGF
jgi:Txe/YoeB family toxin of toxin-antitoxin system